MMIIISDKYKFIFIRPRKMATSSIFLYFTENIIYDEIKKPEYEKYMDIYTHSTPDKIKKIIGEKLFDQYFKFTIIRNPYDMVISWFWYCNRDNHYHILNDNIIINKFRKWVDNSLKNFNPFYNCNYDYIIRFENLHNDFLQLLNILNIPHSNVILPREKSQYRKKQILIYQYYDDSTLLQINEIFHQMFVVGNYQKCVSIEQLKNSTN